VRPDDLRAAGFDDTAILQINLIASWFNYINRVADGLGVGRELYQVRTASVMARFAVCMTTDYITAEHEQKSKGLKQ